MVKGHYKIVNGKRVWVRPHSRKNEKRKTPHGEAYSEFHQEVARQQIKGASRTQLAPHGVRVESGLGTGAFRWRDFDSIKDADKWVHHRYYSKWNAEDEGYPLNFVYTFTDGTQLKVPYELTRADIKNDMPVYDKTRRDLSFRGGHFRPDNYSVRDYHNAVTQDEPRMRKANYYLRSLRISPEKGKNLPYNLQMKANKAYLNQL